MTTLFPLVSELRRRLANRRDRIEGEVPPEYAVVAEWLRDTLTYEGDFPIAEAAVDAMRFETGHPSLRATMLTNEILDMALRVARMEMETEGAK